MEILIWLVIIAILFGYLNLWLIISKEKPTIIINNKFPDGVKSDTIGSEKVIKPDSKSTGEIPIKSNVTVRDIKGEVNLNSEKVGKSNISNITKKIRDLRNK